MNFPLKTSFLHSIHLNMLLFHFYLSQKIYIFSLFHWFSGSTLLISTYCEFSSFLMWICSSFTTCITFQYVNMLNFVDHLLQVEIHFAVIFVIIRKDLINILVNILFHNIFWRNRSPGMCKRHLSIYHL